MSTKFNLHQDANITLIRSYANGKLMIQETEYTHSVIVTSAGIMHWPLSGLDALSDADFAPIFKLGYQPDIVLLGTGERLSFPSPKQTQSLLNAQIGLEVMDTAAASRTYNVLADDGRKVVACLIV
ncbi:MAG: Mth938-like domain-containing protein [Arenicellales bacterium]